MRVLLLAATAALLAMLVGAPAVFAAPPLVGCAGITTQDPDGDGVPVTSRVPAPNDPAMDVIGVFFRWEGGQLTIHQRIKDLAAPDAQEGAVYEFRMHQGQRDVWMRAILGVDDSIRYEVEEQTAITPGSGRIDFGPDGVVTMPVPSSLSSPGAQLTGVEAITHREPKPGGQSIQYDGAYDDVTGGPPPPYTVAACSDDPPAAQKSVSGEASVADPTVAPTPAAEQPFVAPAQARPGAPSMRVLAGKVRRGRVRLTLESTGPLRDLLVTVRRRRGAAALADGFAETLTGRAGVTLRALRPLRRGRHVVEIDAVDASGGAVTFSLPLMLRPTKTKRP